MYIICKHISVNQVYVIQVYCIVPGTQLDAMKLITILLIISIIAPKVNKSVQLMSLAFISKTVTDGVHLL